MDYLVEFQYSDQIVALEIHLKRESSVVKIITPDSINMYQFTPLTNTFHARYSNDYKRIELSNRAFSISINQVDIQKPRQNRHINLFSTQIKDERANIVFDTGIFFI